MYCHRDSSGTWPCNNKIGKSHDGKSETSLRLFLMVFTLAALPQFLLWSLVIVQSNHSIYSFVSQNFNHSIQSAVYFGRIQNKSSLKEDILCFKNVHVFNSSKYCSVATMCILYWLVKKRFSVQLGCLLNWVKQPALKVTSSQTA